MAARELQGRLNDGSALESDEKNEFVDHLRELVDELLQAKQNGDDASPSEWETCKKIALQVSCMKSTFPEHVVEAATFWLKSMEGSRSRRNIERLGSRASSRGGKRNPNDSDSEDDDDIFSASKRGGGNVVVNQPKNEKKRDPGTPSCTKTFVRCARMAANCYAVMVHAYARFMLNALV